jgi:hypothetical protein
VLEKQHKNALMITETIKDKELCELGLEEEDGVSQI